MSQSLNVNDIINIHTDEGVRAAIVVLIARKYTHMINGKKKKSKS